MKIEINDIQFQYIIDALATEVNYLYKFVYEDSNFIDQIKQIKKLRDEIIETYKAYQRGDI